MGAEEEVQKLVVDLKKQLAKKREEEAAATANINMTELLDQIQRSRKASQLIHALIPKPDEVDKKRFSLAVKSDSIM